MLTASTIALPLTVFLFFGKPAFAADGGLLPETSGEWAAFIVMCVLLSSVLASLCFLFVTVYLIIRGHYYNCRIINELDESYELLSTDEKERIKILEMEIDKTLDVYLPGFAKYVDAWYEWSKEDGNLTVVTGKKGKLPTSWRNGYSPYELVGNAMKRVESSMSMEKRFKEKLEKATNPTKKEHLEETIEMARKAVERNDVSRQ